MKWGVCGDPIMARIAKLAGYDYFEWSVGALLHPREEESVFQAALAQVKEVHFPCPAVNVFIPGDLKITGPEVHLDLLEQYGSTALRRAEIAGVETIVFGSGGARRIPDGFDRAVAHRQLVEFCQMLGPIACQHGVTIVIEPLNVSETNVLNTVGEGGDLAREVNHPNIRLLVDGYHWGKDHDTVDGILKNASLLRHAHIATVEGRRPPHAGDECGDFMQVLKSAGYQGRVSIEGNIEHPAEELPAALKILREWAE